MFALCPAFQSLLNHILAQIAASNTPTIFSAHLYADVVDAEELDSDSDSDSGSDGSTTGSPSTIFDSDDESDSGSIISEPEADEEFKGTPISAIPAHVIDEYAVTHVRKTAFVLGRPSPLRSSWTADDADEEEEEVVAADWSLDEDEEDLGAVDDLLTFFAKPAATTPVVLSWADDDSEGAEDLDDLLSFFAKSTTITTAA